MDQSKIDQVTRRVRTLVPPAIDAEGLALDILLESWSNQISHPSRTFIQHRCYDAIRKMHREEQALHSYVPPDPHNTEESEAKVGRLIMILSPVERKIIWYRFYQDLSIQDIARKVSMQSGTVKEILLAALYKMHQEERD